MIIANRNEKELQKDVDEFKDITHRLAELFEKKNKGYGGLWYVKSMRMRFADIERKFIRLVAQLWRKGSYDHDDVHETIKDLIVYCIMALIELERKEDTDDF